MVAFEVVLYVDVWNMFVMYVSRVFSRIFAITERSRRGLYDVHMFMSLLGFGMIILKSMFV